MADTAGTNRRRQIVAAAMELFSDKGYHSASMRDIAERLGLQAGSLYVHIRSKEDVLFEIVDHAADRFADAVRSAQDQARAQGAGPDETLRLAVRNHLQVVAENLGTATVFFHEWKFLDPDRRARILAKRDAYEAAFRDIIAAGVGAGVFRPVDPRIAGLAVMSMCNWFYQWYSPAGPLSAHEIADRFVDLLLAGLRAGTL
ncbi:MAG TPA: TetR/AcrR family transcriptional regulator [Bacillota bacterium]